MNKKALKTVFLDTVPVMTGYLFLGISFGILLEEAGYGLPWAFSMALFMYAGSAQFLSVSLLANHASILSSAIAIFLLNARHIFYGISFIEKFKKYGFCKYFLIFTLSDESYSLHCAHKPQEGVDEKWAHLFSAGFVLFYWLVFTFMGGLVGKLITFDTTGIDFSLTALFVVILVDQMRSAKTMLPAAIAVVSGIVCILLFGAANFILPSLLITVAVLCLLRPRLEKYTEEEEVAA